MIVDSLASRVAVKATFVCAHPGCDRQQVQLAIARNDSPEAVVIDLPLPANWRVVDYRTFCPAHKESASGAMFRLLQAAHEYRQQNPIDIARERLAA